MVSAVGWLDGYQHCSRWDSALLSPLFWLYWRMYLESPGVFAPTPSIRVRTQIQ